MTDRTYVHQRATSEDIPTPDVPCAAQAGDTVSVAGMRGLWTLDHIYTGDDAGYVLVKQDFDQIDANGCAGLSADVAANRIRRV